MHVGRSASNLMSMLQFHLVPQQALRITCDDGDSFVVIWKLGSKRAESKVRVPGAVESVHFVLAASKLR